MAKKTLSEKIAPALSGRMNDPQLRITADDLRALIAFSIGTGRVANLYHKGQETSEIIDGILKDEIWKK